MNEQMKQYTGTKTVKAMPMTMGEAYERKLLKEGVRPSECETDKAGYLVEYEDGYQSWSPADVFEKAYKPSETFLSNSDALKKASYLSYHWRQYSFEQLEEEMRELCGMCNKALPVSQTGISDFERGMWCVIQTVIFLQEGNTAEYLCKELGISTSKIKELQKDCGESLNDEIKQFLKYHGSCI